MFKQRTIVIEGSTGSGPSRQVSSGIVVREANVER